MDQQLTTVIAAYGAVLSTIVFLWNVIRDIRDKGRLKVRVSLTQILSADGGTLPAGPFVKYTIVNNGRRPIYVSNVGGRTAARTDFIVLTRRALPYELQPGERLDELSRVSEHKNARHIIDFCAYDNLDNAYRASRRNTRKVKREIMREIGDRQRLSARERILEYIPARLAKRIGPGAGQNARSDGG